jgi:hypothetical protein
MKWVKRVKYTEVLSVPVKIPRWVPFLLSIVITVGFVFFGKQAHRPVYLAYIIGILLVFFLGPSFDLKMWHELGAYFLLLLGGFATYLGWWSSVPFFDKLVHFLIHLLVGFAAVELWSRYLRDRPGYLILASVGTVALTGYVIELVEQILWIAFGLSMAMPGEFYTDTMADFMVNIGGGLVGIGLWWERNME